MDKINAVELRVGMVISYNKSLWRVVKSVHVHVGGRGGAYMQVELRGTPEGGKLNQRFRTDEKIERPYIEARNMQYLYSDDEQGHFMDQENFEQLTLPNSMLEGLTEYLLPEVQLNMLVLDGTPLSLALPSSVVLEVVETEPRIKGATATASYKPAKTNTGLLTQVPPFIEVGEKIRVSTATGEYQERASE